MTSLFFRFASFAPRQHLKVHRDADRLIRLWGSTAYDQATDLSAREDMGFIASPRAGHWWDVRGEIARRTGRPNSDPAARLVSQAA